MAVEKTSLKLGFVALLDAAPLLVAKERGFFAEQGLTVELLRQPSWASLRDKVAVGALDGAQMLAPMTLAASLGLGGLAEPMVTALALNLGGNAITLSSDLMARIKAIDPDAAARRPLDAAPLGRLADKPTFAIVHPFSAHHYELRLWLAAAGLDAERDVRLAVVPPAQMLSNLSAGAIDGYCVGEPWNHLAARSGLGEIAITSRELWAGRLEKVLGVRQAWADRYPETHRALLRALLQAAAWADQPDNCAELAELLARPSHVNAPPAMLRAVLEGPNRPIFHRFAANFPWRSQAHWFLAQMRKAGQLAASFDAQRLVEQVFRCDLARLAYLDLGLAVPTIDSKVEGGHAEPWTLSAATKPIDMRADLFFDGSVFDPAAAPAASPALRGEK
jgi:ABC-type nitrate/sulfonate/bicarbonate transport system substrate-binding protein